MFPHLVSSVIIVYIVDKTYTLYATSGMIWSFNKWKYLRMRNGVLDTPIYISPTNDVNIRLFELLISDLQEF
jgi:hypothetical protein